MTTLKSKELGTRDSEAEKWESVEIRQHAAVFTTQPFCH